jgi:N-acetylglucosaminyl-diphospho-decaprenol L-rhamnosyltransferase
VFDLAVIIVNWNTRELTLDALRTLYADLKAHGPADTQVWVVDNASTDGSAEAIRAAFPQVHLIANPQNIGFGAGNNLALRDIGFMGRSSDADLPHAIYLLNSDTRTHLGATRSLFEALRKLPDAGVVGAQLFYEDGSFQHGAFSFPGLAQLWFDLLPAPARLYETRFNGRYPRSRYIHGEPFEVDFTLGATMMLRREVIQQTGMFDERFHMYCEEIDWAWRIWHAGWKIYAVPDAHVTHLSGRSTGQVRPRSVVNLWSSRLQLFKKIYPGWKIKAAIAIIRRGMARKIAEVREDSSLNEAQRSDLIAAYETVIDLTIPQRL